MSTLAALELDWNSLGIPPSNAERPTDQQGPNKGDTRDAPMKQFHSHVNDSLMTTQDDCVQKSLNRPEGDFSQPQTT